ncbi:MAG: hypothetical protein J5486_06075 [Bacteroidaceae bacterium]|nr:hypothetical protein [Bacteroidaceae bacterium]
MRVLQYGIALMLSIIMLASCSNDTDDANNAMVVFQVAVTDIEPYKATVTITHNGTNRDTYYGFYVRGKVSDVEGEIRKMLASDQRATVLASSFNQRKRVLQISGLLPRNEFTYIVFGLDNDGNLYGTPASVTFTTIASPLVATETSNWTVTDKGHVVYNDYDYTQINVHLEGDVEERYFLHVCEASLPSTYSNVEDFIFYAVDEFSKSENSGGDEDFWLDASVVRTKSTNFYRYLQPGDYVAYAIGLNEDGTPTGSYAKSEVFHVDKYPYVATYAELLNNDWYFVDSNDKWYFVSFKEKHINYTLTMTGWGNYDDFDVTVYFDRNTGKLTFRYQLVTANEVTIDFSSGSKTGKVYLVGAYYDLADKLKCTRQSHDIAWGRLQEDGSYNFEAGFYVTLTDDYRATELGMTFLMRKGSSDLVSFARMMFPFTLKKLE